MKDVHYEIINKMARKRREKKVNFNEIIFPDSDYSHKKLYQMKACKESWTGMALEKFIVAKCLFKSRRTTEIEKEDKSYYQKIVESNAYSSVMRLNLARGVELSLKAIIIAKQGRDLSGTLELREMKGGEELKVIYPWNMQKGAGHDLVSMAKLADIGLLPRFHEYLYSLSETLKWEGNFPLPSKISNPYTGTTIYKKLFFWADFYELLFKEINKVNPRDHEIEVWKKVLGWIKDEESQNNEHFSI